MRDVGSKSRREMELATCMRIIAACEARERRLRKTDAPSELAPDDPAPASVEGAPLRLLPGGSMARKPRLPETATA